jgi:hypothetical protein
MVNSAVCDQCCMSCDHQVGEVLVCSSFRFVVMLCRTGLCVLLQRSSDVRVVAGQLQYSTWPQACIQAD